MTFMFLLCFTVFVSAGSYTMGVMIGRKGSAKRLPSHEENINIVNGVVLPVPEDPRWKLTDINLLSPDDRNSFVKTRAYGIGSVFVSLRESRVWADGGASLENVEEAEKYAKAVVKACRQREAFRSILGE